MTAAAPPAHGTTAWAGQPPPRRRRLAAPILVAVALVAAALLVVGRTVLPRAVTLGSSSVALAAPASVNGLPRTADLSSQGITLFGRRVADVTSATYGSGDVHYAVVAVSAAAAVGGTHVLLDALSPQALGAGSLDRSSATHASRSGVDYTCWRLAGAAAGVLCQWDAAGTTGVVVQQGSDDATRCATFADAARRSLTAG